MDGGTIVYELVLQGSNAAVTYVSRIVSGQSAVVSSIDLAVFRPFTRFKRVKLPDLIRSAAPDRISDGSDDDSEFTTVQTTDLVSYPIGVTDLQSRSSNTSHLVRRLEVFIRFSAGRFSLRLRVSQELVLTVSVWICGRCKSHNGFELGVCACGENFSPAFDTK